MKDSNDLLHHGQKTSQGQMITDSFIENKFLEAHSCSKVTRKSQEKLGISIMDEPPTLKDDMTP